MVIVLVHAHVNPGSVQEFRQAATENARNSVQEPGVARFDVVQQIDDPTRFVLWEVYRSAEDVARHKETAHFFAWRRAIAGLMAEPLSSIQLANVYPDDAGWD